MSNARDRGAAAVEFAILLPVLILLTFGILAFGHAYHVQAMLDNAARDAVRVAAIMHSDADEAVASATDVAIRAAATSVDVSASEVSIDLSECSVASGSEARLAHVTITKSNFELLGGFGVISLSGTGSMRCNG